MNPEILQGRGGPDDRRSRFERLKPWLIGAWFCLVAVLLFLMARDLDWSGIVDAMRALPASVLLLAFLLALASHLTYSTLDLVGRAYTGHRLGIGRTMATTFVSYATTLSLGSLVGGVGLRLRLYARQGLGIHDVTRVIALSMAGNWVAFALLAGLLLATSTGLPASWTAVSTSAASPLADAASPAPAGMSVILLRVIGVVTIAAIAGLMATSVIAGGKRWRVHRFDFVVPRWPLTLALLALASLNWILMAAIAWVLLAEQVPYMQVLLTLLASAVAGVVAHVPAGVGVFEATFSWLLGGQIERTTLIAALLAYRAVYYLAPLAIAAIGYLLIELNGCPAESRASRRSADT